ncbi:MAG: NAD(P)/FAD-dependent oxidoreductase [Desulfurococcales archaeon]|nr:NAD(P)/FAD-dependent oxidoreductase [Desulfurococcales archaeon]
MTSQCDFDVIILGGGIGGYPAAISLARKGFNVGLVNDGLIGGECTNYGCIPTKALIGYFEYRKCKSLVSVDVWRNGIDFALQAASRSRSGIESVLSSYGVSFTSGKGSFLGERNGCYIINIGDKVYSGEKVLIATGSSPVIPIVVRGLPRLLDNRNILSLKDPPKSILILGAGAVGVEYSRIFANASIRVVLVEMLKNVLPGLPRDLSKQVHKGLDELGVEVYTSTVLDEVLVIDGDRVWYKLSSGEKGAVDYVFNATGRKPNTMELKLDNIDVEVDEGGFIKIDDKLQTSAPGIYAVGDVIGPPLLAHKAYYQSLVASENIAGNEVVFDYPVPTVVFSHPEIVQVGYTWSDAKKEGYNAGRRRVPLSILTRSFIEGWSNGFARMVYDRDTGKILGFEMAGPLASELSGLASYLVANRVKVESLHRTVFPHPTMAEIFRELEEAVRGEPIHYYLKL